METTSAVERRTAAILSEFAITDPTDSATPTHVRWQQMIAGDSPQG